MHISYTHTNRWMEKTLTWITTIQVYLILSKAVPSKSSLFSTCNRWFFCTTCSCSLSSSSCHKTNVGSWASWHCRNCYKTIWNPPMITNVPGNWNLICLFETVQLTGWDSWASSEWSVLLTWFMESMRLLLAEWPVSIVGTIQCSKVWPFATDVHAALLRMFRVAAHHCRETILLDRSFLKHQWMPKKSKPASHSMSNWG